MKALFDLRHKFVASLIRVAHIAVPLSAPVVDVLIGLDFKNSFFLLKSIVPVCLARDSGSRQGCQQFSPARPTGTCTSNHYALIRLTSMSPQTNAAELPILLLVLQLAVLLQTSSAGRGINDAKTTDQAIILLPLRSSNPQQTHIGSSFEAEAATKNTTLIIPLAEYNKTRAQGVDVVYLWVNGSDPIHQAQLQYWQELVHSRAWGKRRKQATLQSRFNADRDELRFSIRSLLWCMPWFRHLYIVTNGQVPSWLDIHNPRVTVVPHRSIFKYTKNLPSYNSNAIETQLHRIPGISDAFIMMNDDFFFTKPWSLQDFINTDGHEVILSAIHPVKTCRAKDHCQEAGTLHADSLAHVDRMFLRYNSEQRFGPAHGPQFVQKDIMAMVQDEFAAEFNMTAAHKFRFSADVHVAAAYKWFVEVHDSGHQHAIFGQARLVRLRDALAQGNAAFHVLQQAWMNPVTKSVCINDDTSDAELLPNINEQVVRFLRNQYPTPSEFELPGGVVNGCTKWLTSKLGQLPSVQDIATACGSGASGATV